MFMSSLSTYHHNWYPFSQGNAVNVNQRICCVGLDLLFDLLTPPSRDSPQQTDAVHAFTEHFCRTRECMPISSTHTTHPQPPRETQQEPPPQHQYHHHHHHHHHHHPPEMRHSAGLIGAVVWRPRALVLVIHWSGLGP